METFVKHFIYGKVNKFATGGKLKATFKWVVDGEEKGHVLTLSFWKLIVHMYSTQLRPNDGVRSS